MEGLKFNVNERYLRVKTQPVLLESLFFWCRWSYSETINVKSIKSLQLIKVMGVPTLYIIEEYAGTEVRHKLSLSRASVSLLNRLARIQNLKDFKNEVQFNKLLHDKGLPNCWANEISANEPDLKPLGSLSLA